MATEVILPKVDMDMESAIIESWKVREGDRVAKGDLLFEIVTNKAAMEVEAPAAGTVAAISGKTGEPIPVGTVVALILGEGESAPTVAPKATAPQAKLPPIGKEEAAPPARIAAAGEAAAGLRATPLARRIARELDVDLSAVAGSGPRGRIAEKDVRAAAAQKAERGGRLTPFDAIRRIAAQRLTESVRNAPHFYMAAAIEMAAFEASLERLKSAAQTAGAERPSATVLIARIAAKALAKHPVMTASVEGQAMRLAERIDIAIAVEHEGTLTAPVLRDVDNKEMSALTAEFRDLLQRLRDRTIAPRDLSGGVFTISNLGMYGVDSFTAIINPPQSGILAVGRTQEKPVGRNGAIVLARMATFTLSSDHRIVDGAAAARFMADFRAAMETADV